MSCPIWSVIILVIIGIWPQGTTDHVNFLFDNFSRIKNVVGGVGGGGGYCHRWAIKNYRYVQL